VPRRIRTVLPRTIKGTDVDAISTPVSEFGISIGIGEVGKGQKAGGTTGGVLNPAPGTTMGVIKCVNCVAKGTKKPPPIKFPAPPKKGGVHIWTGKKLGSPFKKGIFCKKFIPGVTGSSKKSGGFMTKPAGVTWAETGISCAFVLTCGLIISKSQLLFTRVRRKRNFEIKDCRFPNKIRIAFDRRRLMKIRNGKKL
jgi:hypothetical protein